MAKESKSELKNADSNNVSSQISETKAEVIKPLDILDAKISPIQTSKAELSNEQKNSDVVLQEFKPSYDKKEDLKVEHNNFNTISEKVHEKSEKNQEQKEENEHEFTKPETFEAPKVKPVVVYQSGVIPNSLLANSQPKAEDISQSLPPIVQSNLVDSDFDRKTQSQGPVLPLAGADKKGSKGKAASKKEKAVKSSGLTEEGEKKKKAKKCFIF